jgi:hypothetical protein
MRVQGLSASLRRPKNAASTRPRSVPRAVPKHILSRLPKNHRLLQYADLPRHLQARFTTKRASAVGMKPQRGSRDKASYLSQTLHTTVVDPLSEGTPLLPSEAEQLYDEYHAMVGEAMQVGALPNPNLSLSRAVRGVPCDGGCRHAGRLAHPNTCAIRNRIRRCGAVH